MRQRVPRGEEGWVVVIAVIAVGLMLTLGLATYAYVGGQQGQSRDERVRESAFNLGEAALDSAVAFLINQWPSQTSPYPASCTQASTAVTCPDPGGVTRDLVGADFAAGQWSWSTEVHDNGAPTASYYSDQTTRTQPAYDANADGSVWVRSRAVVRGRTRTTVALVKSDRFRNTFPQNAVTAGFFGTSNNGKKTIVTTAGNPPGVAGVIAVRCTPSGSTFPNSCLNYSPSKGQVFPDTRQAGYAGGNALSSGDLDALRKQAQSAGKYYTTSCPSSLTGAVVFIDGPANCSYTGSSTYNSASGTQPGPGLLVIANGTLTLGGTTTYYGLIYGANQQNSTGNVVTLSGTALVVGAITVDGGGGVMIGSTKNGLIFDRNVFNVVTTDNSAAVVRSSWREL